MTTLAPAIRTAATLAIIVSVVLRMVVAFEPLPYWQGDPTIAPTLVLGLSPAWSLTLDLATVAASGLALVAHTLAGNRISRTLLALTVLGALPAWAHALPARGDQVGNVWVGSAWIASWCAALACFHVAQHPPLRRLCAASLTAVIAILAARGAVQVYFEHPQTVQAYRQNLHTFLEERGWTEGSPNHLAYERRLLQREATGWFGLANPYATVAATSGVTLLALTLSAMRHHRRTQLPSGWAGLLVIGSCTAGLALFWARSTGAFGAAAIGTAALCLPILHSRFKSLARIPLAAVGPAVITTVLGAVALRGALGTRIGELSLLFRAQYLDTAVRVFLARPLGVGPAGFQSAYMQLKPPTSPEDVASPHSVIFDYAACLGVLGLAWVAALIGLSVRLGPALLHRKQQDTALPADSRHWWFVIAALGIPLVASSWIEAPAILPENLLFRLVGLIAAIAIAGSVCAAAHAGISLRPALAGGALALLAHAQLDVAPVLPGSAAWLLSFVAIAAAPDPPRAPDRPAPPSRGSRAPLHAAVMLLPLGLTLYHLPPLARWDASLRTAGRTVQPLGVLQADLRALVDSPRPAQLLDDLARRTAALLGDAPAADTQDLARQLATLSARLLRQAAPHLDAAAETFPSHFPTARARSRLHLRRAESLFSLGQDALANEEYDLAVAAARAPTAYPDAPAAAWLWLGDLVAQHPTHAQPRRAIDAWLMAADRDPHGLLPALRLARGYRSLGDLERARAWARAALRIDQALALDPVRRLGDADRAEMARLASGP